MVYQYPWYFTDQLGRLAVDGFRRAREEQTRLASELGRGRRSQPSRESASSFLSFLCYRKLVGLAQKLVCVVGPEKEEEMMGLAPEASPGGCCLFFFPFSFFVSFQI